MPTINIENFSKRYGEFLAVDNIEININAGEIVGFVGKNGAGKSTTIRAMVNMIFPTTGKIRIKGFDAVEEAKKIKQFLGYLPSDSAFYGNMKCRELFKLCLSFSKENPAKVKQLAEYFELDLNKKISELSLGNRKKVSIIQMLLKGGDVLLMDEPTNGLDPLMQNKFFSLMEQEKKKGVTIFLSSHNLSEIEKYCDRVIIIKDGKIVESLDMQVVKEMHKQVVSYTTQDGKEKEYVFDGDINNLVRELSGLNLKHLEIKAATVEDEFIKYYQEEDNE